MGGAGLPQNLTPQAGWAARQVAGLHGRLLSLPHSPLSLSPSPLPILDCKGSHPYSCHRPCDPGHVLSVKWELSAHTSWGPVTARAEPCTRGGSVGPCLLRSALCPAPQGEVSALCPRVPPPVPSPSLRWLPEGPPAVVKGTPATSARPSATGAWRGPPACRPPSPSVCLQLRALS